MACGGGRAGCLLAFSSLVPLSRSRSFACCYTPRVACVAVPIRGVVGRFTGYSDCLPVGVGVFQYMPLNGILWLLMGIFGDVVRCPFSALPVASFSPLCPAARPFSAAVSWRRCGCFPAVSWEKWRVCVLSCSGSFSASRVMWRMASGDGLPYRADGVGGSSCLPLSVRASPAPWGGGLCEVCELRSRLRGGGRGLSSRFSLSRGSRGSSLCHLIISVVIASRSACFVAPVVISLVPHACRHLAISVVVALSLLVSPFLLCHHRPVPPCVPFSPSLPPTALLSVFSCCFLSLFSPFLRRAGRGVLCLLASFVAALVPSSRFPHSLRSSSLVPVLACPTVDLSRRPRFRPRHCRRLCSYLVAVLISFVPPRSSTSVGGADVGSLLFACLIVIGCGPPCRASGGSVSADGGRRRAAAWLFACFGWRRAMLCRRLVVFGLWLACLYI